MSDPKTDSTAIPSTVEENSSEQKIVLVILAKRPKDFKSAQAFLKRRDWDVHLSDNIKDGMALISGKKAGWVLISANLPNTSFDRIPSFLAQTFNVRCIGFGEDTNPATKAKLVGANIPQIQGKPSGPSIQTKIKTILASENASLKDATKKAGGGWKDDNESNIRISSKAGQDRSNASHLKGSTLGESGEAVSGDEYNLGDEESTSRMSSELNKNRSMRQGSNSSGEEDTVGFSSVENEDKDSSNAFDSNNEDSLNTFDANSFETDADGNPIALNESGEDKEAQRSNSRGNNKEENEDRQRDEQLKKSNLQIQKGMRGDAFSEMEKGDGAGDAKSELEKGHGAGDAKSELEKGHGAGDAFSETEEGGKNIDDYMPDHENTNGKERQSHEPSEAQGSDGTQADAGEKGNETNSLDDQHETLPPDPFAGRNPEELPVEEFFHYCIRETIIDVISESRPALLKNFTTQKIGVIAIQSANANGYLCLTFANDELITEDLLRRYRDSLQDRLMKRNFILDKAWNAIIELPIPNVQTWLDSQFDFTASFKSADTLGAAAFMNFKKTLPFLKFIDEDTNRVIVTSDEIKCEIELPCDFFIYLTKVKKIRYLKRNGKMTSEQKDRWTQKKKTEIYIVRDDIYSYEKGFVRVQLVETFKVAS